MGNNAEYWTKRFEELEKAQLLNEAEYITELKETYDKALSTVKKEINNWLVRFAVNNQISLKEAKKWLNSDELKELGCTRIYKIWRRKWNRSNLEKTIGKCKFKNTYF